MKLRILLLLSVSFLVLGLAVGYQAGHNVGIDDGASMVLEYIADMKDDSSNVVNLVYTTPL